MHTAERKMMLLLNPGLWHPIPHRTEEELVKRLMEQCKLAAEAAAVEDEWHDEDVDSDDDCFV